MNEKAIQDSLFVDRGARSLVMCPNYTPAQWWECDVWQVTDAGLGVEYEIKLSMADFRKDESKAKQFYENRDKEGATFGERWVGTQRKKHDLLTERSTHGPSRFYYVVPDTLGVSLGMVPEWAGLMVCTHIRGTSYVRIRPAKEAPKLHRQKVADKIIEACQRVFYYRYWYLRQKRKVDLSPAHVAGDDYSI